MRQSIEEASQAKVDEYNEKLSEIHSDIAETLKSGGIWKSEFADFSGKFKGEISVFNVVNIAAWYDMESVLQSVISNIVNFNWVSTKYIRESLSEVIVGAIAEEECDAWRDAQEMV